MNAPIRKPRKIAPAAAKPADRSADTRKRLNAALNSMSQHAQDKGLTPKRLARILADLKRRDG